jgi:hypothetical protein
MNDKTLLLELAASAPEWTPAMSTPATAAVIDTQPDAAATDTPAKRKSGRPRKDSGDADSSDSPEVVREGRGGKRLLKIVKGIAETRLYWDNLGESYISFAERSLERLGKNNSLEQYLSLLYYKTTGDTLGKDSFNAAVMVLAAQAKETGREIELSTRAGEHEGRFYYDLKNGRALSIGPDSWEIDRQPSIFFRTFSTQQPHPDPVKGGNPLLFFDHTNVAEENRLLLMVWIITAFVPRIPYPALLVSGSAGAGKSFFCKLLKRIIDPSATELQESPKKDEDFDLLLYKHFCLALDNISNIPVARADRLCSAITAAYIEKRMLHTDLDTIVLPCNPRVILNGINALTNRADLLDRSITIHLDRINPTNRRIESELNEAFANDLPGILGGIADTLCKAMAIYPTVNLSSYPRMADFCRWGYAVAEALEGRGAEFLKAYGGNAAKLGETLLENNTFMSGLVQLLDADNVTITGTFKEIIDKLTPLVSPDRTDYSFPTPHTFRRHLERLRPNLEEIGITYLFGKHTAKGHTVELTRRPPPESWAAAATAGVTDDLVFDEDELPT